MTHVQVGYLNVNPVHFAYTAEGQREISQIVFVGYGHVDDYRRIRSGQPQDVVLGEQYIISSRTSAQKTAPIIQAAVGIRGPAPHFIVDRNGNVWIGPGIDAETSYVPEYRETAVFIAVETALAASRTTSQIFELPFTAVQIDSLSVICSKLLTAFGGEFPRRFLDTLPVTAKGFTYICQPKIEGVSIVNFQNTRPSTPDIFDYTRSQSEGFFDLVARQGPFDLATQVWRPFAAPTPVASRAAIATVISTTDTTLANSVYLGAYATIAAEERANEMQTAPRAQLFVQRPRVTAAAANEADSAASHAASVDSASLLPIEIPANMGPHVYDFNTGFWGDNKVV
jgi:hypothetical protein